MPGKKMKQIGIFLVVIGFLLSPIYFFLDDESHMALYIIMSFSPFFIYGGVYLFWRGRQHANKAIAEKVIGDSKPDVLYLRAFETDPSFKNFLLSNLYRKLPDKFFSRIFTEEEQLRDVLKPFGDLVAIGKPGEALPIPGAARLYASDVEWKKVVVDLMQTARLVVFRAGSGEGLYWELKEAAQVLKPKMLLILLLKFKKTQYESFRKNAEIIFNATFPNIHDIDEFKDTDTISGFISFSDNWHPNLMPFKRIPYRGSSLFKPYVLPISYTLKPVFEKNNLEWTPPQQILLDIIGVVVVIGLSLIILVAIIISFSLL